jgi:hypothetical protein
MKGEDRIFLMEAVLVLTSDSVSISRWMSNEGKVDRLLAIRNELGRDGFDNECKKLKEVMTK